MTINKLEKEIKQTLHCEKASYESCGADDDVIKGWIEALEYVLRQINPNKYDEDEIIEYVDMVSTTSTEGGGIIK